MGAKIINSGSTNTIFWVQIMAEIDVAVQIDVVDPQKQIIIYGLKNIRHDSIYPK